jgi:hypothetical protein
MKGVPRKDEARSLPPSAETDKRWNENGIKPIRTISSIHFRASLLSKKLADSRTCLHEDSLPLRTSFQSLSGTVFFRRPSFHPKQRNPSQNIDELRFGAHIGLSCDILAAFPSLGRRNRQFKKEILCLNAQE